MNVPAHEDYRCPQCHGKMEHGYLPTGGGMHWYRRIAAGSDLADAIPGTHTWLRRARLTAWRCKKCQLITFRYGQAMDPDTEQPAAAAEDQPVEADADGQSGRG